MPCGLEPPLLGLDCCGFMVGLKYRQGKGCCARNAEKEKETGDDIKIAAMEETEMKTDEEM